MKNLMPKTRETRAALGRAMGLALGAQAYPPSEASFAQQSGNSGAGDLV